MLIFSFPGDSTKTCFAVPKVCDIYDGGFDWNHGVKSQSCIPTDGESASNFGVPAAGQGALLKSEGVPQYVCKVRVGVVSGDSWEDSWWSTCDQDSCKKDAISVISCPGGGVGSDRGGLYF